MDPNMKLAPNPDDNEPNRSNSYAKLLGCLQFIANSTRPDICYAVNELAAYTANPGSQNHGAIKRILQYLAGMKTLGITYNKSRDENGNQNLFHGYADAAFANADDHKSTTGYVFLAAGGAITWKSKKQTVPYPPQKRNMWLYQKQDAKQYGSETYMENSDFHKNFQSEFKAMTKGQLY
jgi:hypothetical protein